MIAASKAEVVPPAAAKALWEATGKQKIVWLNTSQALMVQMSFSLFR